jgi:hypothetical protein
MRKEDRKKQVLHLNLKKKIALRMNCSPIVFVGVITVGL